MTEKNLYFKTPLIESNELTTLCGIPAFLKLENVQPSGSFKIRGISNLVLKRKTEGATHLVTASGGNAGMATAYTGKILNIPTTVVIPENVPSFVISKLENEKANVQVVGQVWNDAEQKALELAQDESSLYVHPFDHPLVWEGIEPLVDEIVDQCPLAISAVVLSVGGGGLLCGVLQGLQNNGLNHIPVVALETEGAHSFSAALKAGHPVSIGNITSVAKTLGALSVTPRVFDLLPQSNVISKVVHDREALKACSKFLDDHRFLVEPSCGAALSAGYSHIISDLVDEGKIDKKGGAVVFIVCGGSGVTMEQLAQWKKSVGE